MLMFSITGCFDWPTLKALIRRDLHEVPEWILRWRGPVLRQLLGRLVRGRRHAGHVPRGERELLETPPHALGVSLRLI